MSTEEEVEETPVEAFETDLDAVAKGTTVQQRAFDRVKELSRANVALSKLKDRHELEFSDLKTKFERSLREVVSLKSSLADRDRQLAVAHEEEEDAHRTLEEEKRALQKSRASLAMVSLDVDALKTQRTQLREEVASLNESHASTEAHLQQHIDSLTEKISTLKDRKNRLEEKLQHESDSRRERENEISQIRMEMQHKEESRATEQTKHEEEVGQLRSEIAGNEASLDQLRAEMVSVQSSLKLEAEQRWEQLQGQLDTKTAAVGDLTTQNALLTGEVGRLKAEVSREEVRFVALQEKSQLELQQLREKHDADVEKIRRLKGKKSRLEDKFDQKDAHCMRLSEKVDRLEGELKHANHATETLRSETDSTIAHLKKSLEEKETELGQQKESYQRLELGLGEKTLQWKSAEEDLTQDLAKVRSESETLQQQHNAAKLEIVELSRELALSRDRVSRLEQDNEQMTLDVDVMKFQLSNLGAFLTHIKFSGDGWLLKQGHRVRNWKWRYFKCNADTRTLSYYNQPNDARPIKSVTIPSEQYTVEKVRHQSLRRGLQQHQFQIVSTDAKGKRWEFKMAATNSAECQRWITFWRKEAGPMRFLREDFVEEAKCLLRAKVSSASPGADQAIADVEALGQAEGEEIDVEALIEDLVKEEEEGETASKEG